MLIVEGFRGSVDTSVRIGVREAQDAALWVGLAPASGVIINTLKPHPLDLGIEMGVVRLLAPHLTSLMWLGVVSSMCHAPSLVLNSIK